MIYIVSLAIFTIIIATGLHFSFRHKYGINQPFWAKVEIAWWVMSFVSALLATAQFEDKRSGLEREALAKSVLTNWAETRRDFDGIEAQLLADGMQPQFAQKYGADEAEKILDGVRLARRGLEIKGGDAPRDIYTRGLSLVCLHPLNWKVFSEQNYTDYLVNAPYEGYSYPDTIPGACMSAYMTKMDLDALRAIDTEHDLLRPFYTASQWWFFLLFAGFALKFTKNRNDLERAKKNPR